MENENYSIRADGIRYGIPESTIRQRLKSSTPRVNRLSSPSFGRLPVFNKEQESMLKDKVLKASDLYHGVTPRQCKSIAFNLAEKC
uniref:HTH psq-type domain-containing protein n=1 Tax=Trichogramma kaykai TaxID=54128 RepID=A0ABD2WY21_9HYME